MLRVAMMCLVVLCVVDNVFAQTARGDTAHSVRIEGTVRAPDGSVLPGATVHIFGTRLTTTTEGDGRYTLAFTHVPARLTVVVDLDNYRGDDRVVEIDGSADDDGRLHADPGVCLRGRGHRRGSDA